MLKLVDKRHLVNLAKILVCSMGYVGNTRSIVNHASIKNELSSFLFTLDPLGTIQVMFE